MDKYNKKLKNEFIIIKNISDEGSENLSITDKNKMTFYYKDKKFIIETLEKINTNPSKFRFENINNKEVILEKDLKIKVLDSIISSSSLTSKFTINKFSSLDFSEDDKLFYRLVISNVDIKNIRYEFYFNNLIHINNRYFEGIEFTMYKYTFQIYTLDDFFIIESLDKIDYKQFDKYARGILGAFGFITGFVPMDYGYYFTYDKYNENSKTFLYASDFLDTYKSNYSIVDLNAQNYYQHQDLDLSFEDRIFKDDSRIEELKALLKPITKDIFENLCTKIIDNEQFSEIIYGLLSVNNANLNKVTLVLKGGLYSIILEMLTSLITNENKDKLYTITDKKMRKEFKNKLNNLAENFFISHDLGDYNKSYIKAKISNINAQTNADKLKAPFQILSIELNENEEQIIKYRNDFLHGRNPYENKELEEQFKNLLYITLELNFLVNALILKYIGYDGVVKNLSKIYLDYKEIDFLSSETYFKKI